MEIKCKADSAEIIIYEDIGEGWLGGLSAKRFADEVKKIGNVKDIAVRINSYGGSVFDGLAMYNTLRNHGARITVQIDGIAASIASIIAMAGDEITIAENGFMMIHDPWVVAAGNAADLREQADLLDKVRGNLLDTYMKKATVPADQISQMMADETWLTADEAVAAGLVDSITEEVKLAACANAQLMAKYRKTPCFLSDLVVAEPETPRRDAVSLKLSRMAVSLRRRNL